MFILNLDTHIIHDVSCPRYECHIDKIPKDRRKKIFTLGAVKRLLDENTKPPYNGCRWCMAEFYQFDMTSIYQTPDAGPSF